MWSMLLSNTTNLKQTLNTFILDRTHDSVYDQILNQKPIESGGNNISQTNYRRNSTNDFILSSAQQGF